MVLVTGNMDERGEFEESMGRNIADGGGTTSRSRMGREGEYATERGREMVGGVEAGATEGSVWKDDGPMRECNVSQLSVRG